MVAPRDLTVAFYDSLPVGSIERAQDPKPNNADALMARKRAIRDGRLRVLDTIEQEQSEDCTGCFAEDPLAACALVLPIDGEPPVPPGFGSPAWTSTKADAGGFTFDPGSMPPIQRDDSPSLFIVETTTSPGPGDKPNEIRRWPGARFEIRTGGGGLQSSLYLSLQKLRVVTSGGTCVPGADGCEQETPCSFLVQVTLDARKSGPDAWPDLSFDVPSSGVAAGTRTPGVNQNGVDYSTYEFQFAWSVPCGGDAFKFVSFEPFDGGGITVTPTGTWEKEADVGTFAVLWLYMQCFKCLGQG